MKLAMPPCLVFFFFPLLVALLAGCQQPAVAPTADFSAAPANGDAPLTVQFADQSVPGTSPITAWFWDFGDGATSNERHPSRTYADAGMYNVTLTVTSADGSDSETKPRYINVSAAEEAPTANFTGSPRSGVAPLTVQFSDSSTPGSSPITRRSWNFGDGQTSTQQNPSHNFSTPGTYTVTLSVTTADGNDTETKSAYIDVTPAPQTIVGNAAGLAGAEVTVQSMTGTSLATGLTDPAGGFAIDIPRDLARGGFRLQVEGGSLDGLVFEGALSATYASSAGNGPWHVTAITTLVDAIAGSGLVPAGEAFARQSAAIARLEAMGMVVGGAWADLRPTTVNTDAAKSRMLAGSIQAWTAAIVADIADGDLSPDFMDVFPRAHGGVAEVDASAKAIAGAPLQIEAQVALRSGSRSGLAFTLEQAPAGMSVDANGVIALDVPGTALPGLQPFRLRVADRVTGVGRSTQHTLEVVRGTIVAEGALGPAGGTLSDAWDEVSLEAPANALSAEVQFRIVRAEDAEGGPIYTVWTVPANASIPASVVLRLPDVTSPPITEEGSKAVDNVLMDTWAYILSSDRFLLPDSLDSLYQRLPRGATIPADYRAEARRVSRLLSHCGASTGSEGCAGKQPVLFVHGYSMKPVGVGLGGGEGTWGDFMNRIGADDRFASYEFQYYSGARFQDIASDLADAIAYLARRSGSKVHLVAHSFGGLVARTYLQGLAAAAPSPLFPGIDTYRSYGDDVASLSTLGTPHSGIAADCGELHQRGFPQGFDNLAGAAGNLVGAQLTVHQAGNVIVTPDSALWAVYRMSPMPGEIVAGLANLAYNPLPGVPTQVLIGLSRGLVGPTDGDGLIRYQGQRFHPSFALNGTTCTNTPVTGEPITAIEGRSVSGILEEHLLGLQGNILPGNRDLDFRGYQHSTGAAYTTVVGLPEANLDEDCEGGDACAVPYESVLNWLDGFSAGALDPASFTFRIRVLDAFDSSPIESAALTVYRYGRVLDGVWETDSAGLGVADAPYTGPGRYTMRVDAPGYHPAETVVGAELLSLPNGEVQLDTILLHKDLDGRGSLSGFVLDNLTGETLTGVTIVATNGFGFRTATTNSDGFYILPELARGTWLLRASIATHEAADFTFPVLPEESNDGPIYLTPNSPGPLSLPAVRAYDPDEHGWIGNVAGKLSGWVSDTGGARLTETRLEWGRSVGGSDWQVVSFFDGSTGSFRKDLSGLSYGTTYYVRAGAVNAAFPGQMVYSNTYSFRTSSTRNRPEFVWDSYRLSTTQGFVERQDYYIILDYGNIGDVSGDATLSSVYISIDDDGNYLDDWLIAGPYVVPGIDPGSEFARRVDFTMPDLGSGAYQIKFVCVVDQYDEVDELNDSVYWVTLVSYSAFDAARKQNLKTLPDWYPAAGQQGQTESRADAVISVNNLASAIEVDQLQDTSAEQAP